MTRRHGTLALRMTFRIPRHGPGAWAAGRVFLLLVLAACGESPRSPGNAPTSARYDADGKPEDPAVRATRRPSILLICLDTVRADAFAPWSDEPLFAECSAWFAARGTAFRQAVSAAPWTAPAVASLLTGLLPSRHGARDLAPDLTVVPSVTTLAELLGVQGWRRAAFAGGGWVSTHNGMLQGFEHSLESFSFGAATPHLLSGFPALGKDPWFVFAHTFEAHDPYLAPPAEPGRGRPPPPPVDLAAVDREAAEDGGRSLTRRFLLDASTRSVVFENALGGPRIRTVTRYFERGFRADPQGPALAAEARAAYDEGLRRLDRAVATFLREVEARGLLKEAVVFLVSDHGEAFGEHGTLHHGRMLHDVLVHVPLLVAGEGFAKGAIVDEPCSLLDVLPTVCELAGLPTPEGIDGRSLLPLARGGRGRPVIAEERRTEAETGFPGDETLVAVRDARWTWIRTTDRATGSSSEEIFDRASDPGETSSVGRDRAELSDEFRTTQRAARTTR